MTQLEEDALVCYLMAIKEEKRCMAWWVGIAERVCREKWPEAFDRLMKIHDSQEGRAAE
jgi:hypothetical protein